jgi:hypothetical protein
MLDAIVHRVVVGRAGQQVFLNLADVCPASRYAPLLLRHCGSKAISGRYALIRSRLLWRLGAPRNNDLNLRDQRLPRRGPDHHRALASDRQRKYQSSRSVEAPRCHSFNPGRLLWLRSSRGKKRLAAPGTSNSRCTGARPIPVILWEAGALRTAGRDSLIRASLRVRWARSFGTSSTAPISTASHSSGSTTPTSYFRLGNATSSRRLCPRTADGSSPASGNAARRISACRLFGGFFFYNRG